MHPFRVAFISFLCFVYALGAAEAREIGKDACASTFLKNLLEAYHGKHGGGTDDLLGLKLNLKYTDKSGERRKAVIQLSEHCRTPQILCEGDTSIVNGEILSGPLLHCSWKWNEGREFDDNHIVVRLNTAIHVTGRVAKDDNIFPDAGDKEPLKFSISTSDLIDNDVEGTLPEKEKKESVKAQSIRLRRKAEEKEEADGKGEKEEGKEEEKGEGEEGKGEEKGEGEGEAKEGDMNEKTRDTSYRELMAQGEYYHAGEVWPTAGGAGLRNLLTGSLAYFLWTISATLLYYLSA